MWIAIDGLGVKKIDYFYNSQDQVTYLTVLAGDDEARMFRYRYDIPGRLAFLDIPDNPAADNPFYFNLVRYLYNQNSLISSLRLNAENVKNDYLYYERNWILNCTNNLGIFNYFMSYFPNRNVAELQLSGNYKNNFSDDADMNFEFNYDKSNRLLNAISNYNGIDNAFNLRNTYDRDGNILTMKRYLSDGSTVDNFNYTYYSGTNKLKNTGNVLDDYEYDLNGNLVKDSMNKNVEIKYDHRNLITFIKHHLTGHHGEVYTQAIFYYYDEAGNRIRKVIFRAYKKDPVVPEDLDNLEQYPEYDEETFNSAAEDYYNQLDQPTGPGEPEPGNGEEDNPFLVWYLVSNEFYIRGVEGNELVILEKYSGGEQISKYNFFGSGNEGYIDAGDRKYFYLKDHLGSVRVVLNENNDIVSAQDYDVWGYLMAGRNYDSNLSQYKFTGKERDKESNYDYFGARYYDARIGRWGQVDRSWDKLLQWSPYKAYLDNPLKFIDPDGAFEVDPAVAKQFPKFYNYLKNDFINITVNKKIMDALTKYSGLTVKEITDFVKLNKGPKLFIQDLGYDENGKEIVGGILTEKRTGKILGIGIDIDLVNNLENALGDQRDVYSFYTGVILLHELTHYGVMSKGIEYLDVNTQKIAEHGELFEKMAYGMAVSNYNKAVEVLNKYNEQQGISTRYHKMYETEEVEVTP